MLDFSHFLVACLAGSGVMLGNVILALVRRRNGHNGDGMRVTMTTLSDDLRELHAISQGNAVKLAGLERDVEWIKKSLRLNGYGAHE